MSDASPDFPVDWPFPGAEDLTWIRDAMHFPSPLTPLTVSFLREGLEHGVAAACEELQMPISTLRHTAFNGWVFNAAVPAGSPEEMGPRMERHGPLMVDHMDNLRRRWDEGYRADVERLTAELDALDFTGTGDGAVAEFRRLVEISIAIWRIHFLIVLPKLGAGERFSAMYTEITGTTNEMEPYRCLMGEPNKTLETDRELKRLADDARAAPVVAAALLEESAADALARLDESAEGRAWRERLDAFLDTYGQRAQLIELSSPTWQEEPSFVLENLHRFLTDDALDPEEHRQRTVAEATALIDAARARVAGNPELSAAFDAAYAAARAAWPLEEDHAFYIDQRSLAGATRRAFLRIAQAFTQRGQIEIADDIWYLDFDAVRDGLEGAALVARAQDGRRRFADGARLEAPPLLGAPPDPDTPVDPGLVKFFGKPGPPEVEGQTLRGSAGSKGRIEGIARVVRTIDDLHRVQVGEILVCRSTTPPWTPIFGSIAALVTDTGGVLAHGAIVAREYGIPAVMGTKIATRMIQDGQRITVDGDRGEVLVG